VRGELESLPRRPLVPYLSADIRLFLGALAVFLYLPPSQPAWPIIYFPRWLPIITGTSRFCIGAATALPHPVGYLCLYK
jgi:hypothetical protein